MITSEGGVNDSHKDTKTQRKGREGLTGGGNQSSIPSLQSLIFNYGLANRMA